MSQAGGGQPLGTARIDIVGDTSKLKAAASEAVQITKKAAGEAQQASVMGGAAGGGGAGVAGPIGEIGAAAGKTETSLMGMFRGLMRVGGVVTALAGVAAIFAKIHDNLTGANERAAAFYRTLEGQGPLQQQKALAEQINKTYEALIRAEGSVKELVTGGVVGRQREIEALKELGKWTDALAIKEADRNRAAKEKAEADKKAEEAKKKEAERTAFHADVEKRFREAEKAAMSEEQKILADTEDQIIEIEDLKKRAGEEDKARLEETERLIREAGNRRYNEFIRRREDETKKAREEAQKQAMALEKSFTDAFARIRQQGSTLFPSQVEAQLGRMVELLQIISERRRSEF